MIVQVCISLLQQGLPALGPVLVETFELSLVELGYLISAVSGGVVLTIYSWGHLADKVGERFVVAVGLSGSSLALLVAAFQSSPTGVGLSLFVAGAFGSAAVVSSGRAVSGWFSGAELGFALGLRQTAIPIGAVFAASMVPLVVWQFGVKGVFICFSAISIVGAIVGFLCFTKRPLAENPLAKPAKQAPPLKDSKIWHLACASGLIQWSQVSLNSFLAVMLVENQNLSTSSAVAIFATVHILSAFTRVFLGWWSDRSQSSLTDLARCAALVAVSTVAAGVLTAVQSPVSVGVLALATVLSLSWNALAITSLVGLAGHSRVGSALGLFATLMRVCTLPCAILFGWAAAELGWMASLLVLAAFPAVGAVMIRSLKHRLESDAT